MKRRPHLTINKDMKTSRPLVSNGSFFFENQHWLVWIPIDIKKNTQKSIIGRYEGHEGS